MYLTVMGEPILGGEENSQPFERWFASTDRNRDGGLDVGELQQDAERFFALLDVDHDGRISADEITRYERQVAPPALRAMCGAKTLPKPRPPSPNARDAEPPITGTRLSSDNAPPPMDFGDVPNPVAMADTDLSRSVTPEEFRKAAKRRFAARDANHDGRLDREELTAGQSRSCRR